MDWRDLRLALALGQHGTLSRAASALGLDPTTLSRRVTALEEELGAALFVRQGRRWRPTPAGLSVLARCERMASEVRAIRHDADRTTGRVRGVVRLTTLDAVITTWLVPALPALQRAHPDLRLELYATNDLVDLAKGRADVAVRVVPPTAAGLVVKRLREIQLVAAGRPEVVALPLHERPVVWLGFLDSEFAENTVLQQVGGPVACTATSYLVLLALLRAGIGVGVLPRLLAEAEGFQIVPADVPPRTLWRVVLEETRDVPRVRAVCEWLDATLGD